MRTNPKAVVSALLGVLLAPALLSPGVARATTQVSLRLPGRSLSVTATKFVGGRASVDVRLHGSARRSILVARSDFKLSASGDIFGAERWDVGGARTKVAPGHSRVFRLTFRVPSAVLRQGTLFYRTAGGGISGKLTLDRTAVSADAPVSPAAGAQPTIGTFWITHGAGEPWGTAVDSSGHIWFAEPGCDFTPTCPAGTPPGQLGEFDPSSGTFSYYTLPNIPGNQPIFLAFDDSGNLWFTTPNNDKIGEFSPSTSTFAGQWSVTPGSGPWDLVVANGRIWYTEHFVSAVGSFDPATHTHQDFQTPTGQSQPYGISANGGRIWFTENNSSVDRVAVLDTTGGNAISEYPIVQPVDGTPHLIVVDSSGHPWWTEGWSNTIATLDPAAATPGSCGSSSGTCSGIQRFKVPATAACGNWTHTSGIAYDRQANRIWLDNSLTAQVGSFTPSNQTFTMTTLSDCNAHPHDGLNLDEAGHVWFDEEFANALGELIPPGTSASSTPLGVSMTPNPPLSGSDATFTANWPNPANIAQAQWRFGDGTTASGNPVTHKYASVGTKTLTVLIKDNDGNKAQVTEAVSVETPPPPGKTQAPQMVMNGSSPTGAPRHAGTLTADQRAKRVKAGLSKLLAAVTSRRTIAALRAKGRAAVPFAAPSAGSVLVFWQPTRKRKRVRLATARTRCTGPGSSRITIQLTRQGRQFLRRHRNARLAAKVVFLPTGGSGAASRTRFALKPQ